MARKMMAAKARYLGTDEERAEIAAKYRQGHCLTLDECSKVMGLSRSAIKAIEARALAKLRKEIEKRYGKNMSLADFVNTTSGRRCAAIVQAGD